MNKNKVGILVENIYQLNRLKQPSEGVWVIPGSYRVEVEALMRGYRCFSGHGEVVRGVSDDAISIINEIKNRVSGGYVDTVISEMLLRIFKSIWLSRLEQVFGAKIKTLEYGNGHFGGHWQGCSGPVMHTFEGGLDFTSNSSYINRHPGDYKKIIFKENDLLGIGSLLRNIYDSIWRRGSLIYIPVCVDGAKDANSEWLREYNYKIALMDSYCRALLVALRSASVYPSIACFNYGTVQNVGIARALSFYNIPVRLDSHGCMVYYGGGSASEVRSLLSKNIYNDFSGVTEVCTRSPMQSKDVANEKKNIVKPLVRGYKRSRTHKNIRVGYVPNFLPLSGNYHGVTPSCYDVRRAAELLIKDFSGDERFELHVRIKTHVGNGPKNFDFYSTNIDRGIAPIDFKKIIYFSGNNVFDDSAAEYSNYLDDMDIIITSGVTSVVFDALERRVPVLFYSSNDDDVSPLPVENLKSIFFTDNEVLQPVYRVSDLEDLRPGLIKLISKMNDPNFIGNDNEVLSKFIWVN